MKTQVLILWHQLVCEPYREGERYRCHHCGNLFERNEVCGDHFPTAKGVSRENKFNTLNGVCSCMRCNQSDSKTRRLSLQELSQAA
jgi:hypothetical protein